MPSSIARRGEGMGVSTPSIRITPRSGLTRPQRMPISVDLPAPFSPNRQWISPPRTVRSMLSLARTFGNAFVMPRSSTSGETEGCGWLTGPLRRGCSGRPQWAAPNALEAGLTVDQLLYLFRAVRDLDLDLAREDLRLRLCHSSPGVLGDVLRLQEGDPPVLQGEVVPVRSVRALVHIFDGLR